MRRANCVRAFALSLIAAGLTPTLADAQSRWMSGGNSGGWNRNPSMSYPETIDFGRGYSGRSGGHSGYGYPHSHDDGLNFGLILTPDWVDRWSNGPSGPLGSAPPGSAYYGTAGGYHHPVLEQPPFYSGQPAPNFYQAPIGFPAESRYETPQSFASPSLVPQTAQPKLEAQGAHRQRSSEQPGDELLAAESQTIRHAPTNGPRRRSILVRPGSEPLLSQTLADNSPGQADYTASLAAFASGDYAAAVKAAEQAAAADSSNGKLQLYLAQCQFAIGDYPASAATLSNAFTLLNPDQWGLVVENFRQFYKQNDYVPQFDQLIQFAEQPENRAIGLALQAYHYLYLGHAEAAAELLKLSLQSESPPALAMKLRTLLPATAARVGDVLPPPNSER